VVEALDSLAELGANKIDLSIKIEQARQRFFREYPNGANRTQAEVEFTKLLIEKDLWYFFIAFQTGGGGTFKSVQDARAMDQLFGLGARIDNGIRPFALEQFNSWTSLYYEKVMGGPSGTRIQIDSLEDLIKKVGFGYANPAAHAESKDEYERYRLARDWAEFAAAGYNITGDPKNYLLSLFIVEKPYNRNPQLSHAEQAATYYKAVAEIFGEEAMLQAAKRLMAAKKDQYARIILDSQAVQPHTAFVKALAETNKRAYVMTIILLDEGHGEFNFGAADITYKRLVAAYGESALFDASEQVRRAPRDEDGSIKGLEALGVRQKRFFPALQELLTNQYPIRYVRSILAYHDNLTSAQEVDASYAKLVATYGDSAVKAAGENITAFWRTELPADAPKEYQILRQNYFLGRALGRASEGGAQNVSSTPTAGKKRMTTSSNGLSVYGLLFGLLDGSLTLPRAATNADMMDDLTYLTWAKFPIGTTVTYAFRGWAERSKQIDPRTNRDPNPYQGLIQVYKLTELNAQGGTVELSEKSFSPQHNPIVRSQNQGFGARVLKRQIEKPKTFVSESSGTEPLEVNGKTYQCRWRRTVYGYAGVGPGSPDYVSTIMTTWESDEVPGGLVREREETSSGDLVNIREKVIQPFRVNDLATLTNAPTVSFQVKPDAAPGSSQTSTLAKTGASEVAATNTESSTPPSIPYGSGLSVTTVDVIDLRGVDSGRRFHAQLEQSLKFGGQIILLKGTDVFLKARRQATGVMIAVDYIVVGGNRIAVTTNEIFQVPQVPQSTGGGQGRESIRLPGRIVIPIPKSPRQTGGTSSEQDRQIPPQTRLPFLTISESTPSPATRNEMSSSPPKEQKSAEKQANIISLQQEVGAYRANRLGAAAVNISVTFNNGKLLFTVPGQPTYLLENIGGRRYRLLVPGHNGFFVTFRPVNGNEGKTEMFLEQPQGNFVALKIQ